MRLNDVIKKTGNKHLTKQRFVIRRVVVSDTKTINDILQQHKHHQALLTITRKCV